MEAASLKISLESHAVKQHKQWETGKISPYNPPIPTKHLIRIIGSKATQTQARIVRDLPF